MIRYAERAADKLSAPDVPPWQWAALDAAGDLVSPSTLTEPPLGVALGSWSVAASIACVRRGTETARVVQRELDPIWAGDGLSRCWRRLVFAFAREGDAWHGEQRLTLIGGPALEASSLDLADMTAEQQSSFASTWRAAIEMVENRAPTAPLDTRTRAVRALAGFMWDRPQAPDPWRSSGAGGILRDWGMFA